MAESVGGSVFPGESSTPSIRPSDRSSQRDNADLGRRVIRHLGVRLVVLLVFLGVITLVYFRDQTIGGFSWQVALSTVAVGFALSAVFAVVLRAGKFQRQIGYAQLCVDQGLWTALVYISGGVSSGGVSLYGLTCVIGAVTLGKRGAITAFVAALLLYTMLAAALIEGLILAPPDQTVTYASTFRDVGYPVFANLFGVAVVASLAAYLSERLRTTGGDLEMATARAEQAEQLALLGKLAAGLAHEIRNPLGAIAGSVELLRTSRNLTEEDRHLCQIVQQETSRLNDLVGDMLDLARSRPPQVEKTDLAKLVRDVVTLARESGRGRDVSVEFTGPEEAFIEADASQFRQVAWNLVRNAVSVSSPGETVRVSVTSGNDGSLFLAVKDQGPGIPSDARDRLFDAFFTTRSQGTGVGLAVVKRILDEHKFTIRVESSSSGATFSVVVPKTSVC